MNEGKKPQLAKSPVKFITMTEDDAGQRIDNYLICHLKGMPKSHIYRLLRKGEVRVNKKRIAADYRLAKGDVLRLPPMVLATAAEAVPPSQTTIKHLTNRIIYEDNDLLILNKPSGMSVHVGSTVRMGVIEALRHHYSKLPQLELAHRLDTETSGCLVLAKKKRVLRELHELLRTGQVKKTYWTLTKGKWSDSELRVDLPLHKDYRDGGKHVVSVAKQGKSALTIFRTLKHFKRKASLMEVNLMTGRTHQIRVHAMHQGHPVAGDDRYGDAEFNKQMHELGLKRMFLHAKAINFTLPSTGLTIRVEAPLDVELIAALEAIEATFL